MKDFRTNECIATDLYCPEVGAVKDKHVLRDYYISSRDKTFNCSFRRRVETQRLPTSSFV